MSRVSYVHSSRASFRKSNRFRSLSICAYADFDFQLIFYNENELKPLDISYDQNILQRTTLNFEIHRRIPRVEQTDEIKKEHKHISLSLSPSLSLSTCRSADALFTLIFSLSLRLQQRFGSISVPNGIQERM